ncbi:MAG: hypothetical protein EZS28_023041 [Streblomastix strix]|uniref:Uncharacterized protein n=1 Tax=Streblomastix strix TaxID=222440 RepID=A0A5J4VG21_9EUKA|nr:MAG: hypothetical protein EZS28_023041 [Streblomastix strix]
MDVYQFTSIGIQIIARNIKFINNDLSKYEAGRVEHHRMKLTQAKQSVALIITKIQAEEADFEEITERAQQHRLSLEQIFYVAESERNQEIFTLHSELEDINDELRYYEQRAVDRKDAIKGANEQVENYSFELD